MRHGSFQNTLYGNMLPKPEFQVGDGATIILWTDRYAGTIIAINRNGREIVVQEDIAIRTDGRGMSDAQQYEYQRNTDGRTWTATLRKDGTYRVKGEDTRVLVGERHQYRDFSF